MKKCVLDVVMYSYPSLCADNINMQPCYGKAVGGVESSCNLLKRIIVVMDDQQLVDMSCPVTKFCISAVLCRICRVGMGRMILAWNAHSILRHGTPNVLQAEVFHTSPIHPVEVLQCSSAVNDYRQQGGHLTDPSIPGTDLLDGDDALCSRREQLWERECGMDVGSIYSEIILLGCHGV